jgi:hypothetical protein
MFFAPAVGENGAMGSREPGQFRRAVRNLVLRAYFPTAALVIFLCSAGSSGSIAWVIRPSIRLDRMCRAFSIAASSQSRRLQGSLTVKVVDEDGVPVASALLTLSQGGGHAIFKGETDYAGRVSFLRLSAGLYQLQVEKEGFYSATVDKVHVGKTGSIEVTINHQRKYVESVRVTYSPPIIDPTQTTSSEQLNSREIIDLPYAVPRDIRYALPLLPGVLQDASGQIHIDGSATNQVYDELDGFDITDPITSFFNVRIAPEALRSVTVQDSRYPVQYGKASGGILALESGMGDDHFRFAGINFLPGFEERRGFHLSNWTPRMTFSGPLHKGRAWFMDGFDGEYELNIVNELPPGADQNTVLRFSNLSKAQVNLTSSNILTGSFLMNHFHAPHEGLSPFNPLESTINSTHGTYILTLKDQAFFANKTLLEVGLGATRLHDASLPLGNMTYVQYPGSVSGNYFETSRAEASRIEEMVHAFLPPRHWAGQHEIELGTEEDQIRYHQALFRNPFQIDRDNGTLLRRVSFLGGQAFAVRNFEVSSYVEDRWSLLSRLLVEPGLRFDWDDTIHNPLLSPRLALSFVPGERDETKIAAGIGLYNDATNLALITRPLAGERLDYFYDPSGMVQIGPPLVTSFQLSPHLREPRVWNWSAGMEHKFPHSIYLRAEYVQKREQDGWAYFNTVPMQPRLVSGPYELRNDRRDRYDAVRFTFRHRFQGDHILLASYTRSRARSNAVLDFGLENPIFAGQQGGPLPWDSPNRVMSWGLIPLWKKFDLAYALDWRTGFPFNVFNQNQQLVGAPGARRFPAYFSLNAALERRISLFGFKWDLRAGLNDLTNRHNPFVVDSNIDSPHFLTYSSLQGRTLEGQFRLLGRK